LNINILINYVTGKFNFYEEDEAGINISKHH